MQYFILPGCHEGHSVGFCLCPQLVLLEAGGSASNQDQVANGHFVNCGVILVSHHSISNKLVHSTSNMDGYRNGSVSSCNPELPIPFLISLQRSKARRHYDEGESQDDEIEGKRTYSIESKLRDEKFNVGNLVKEMKGEGILKKPAMMK